MEPAEVFAAVESRQDRLIELARDLWRHPELGLAEERAAELLCEELTAAGFTVETGVGGMPTAFVASYGTGDPTIGILGEYDALPDLSQTVSATREPVERGGPGHGCGHNLFGVAGVGAALALKDAIDRGAIEGTIRFYGTPAEEQLVGKVYMARDGVFDDLDAAITWHPADVTGPQHSSSLAMDSIRYTFEGTPAHAAQSPSAGRSALDGVELMNTGVEYMREHLPQEARVHYTITDGGSAPNVVPSEASVWYYVRAPTRRQVERITDWVDDVASGAATMTQTDVSRRFVTGSWEFLVNDTIANVMFDTLQDLGPIEYAEADREFAAELQETIDEGAYEDRLAQLPPAARMKVRGESLYVDPLEYTDATSLMLGSTDVGDVSWITPTAQFRVASWPVGTTAHTWQAVAASGGFGTKSAVYAGKALAGTAYRLFTDDTVREAATDEFDAARGDRAYESPLPADASPPFDISMG